MFLPLHLQEKDQSIEVVVGTPNSLLAVVVGVGSKLVVSAVAVELDTDTVVAVVDTAVVVVDIVLAELLTELVESNTD